MRVLHLGGNALGDRIFSWLRSHEEYVSTVDTLRDLTDIDVRNFDWVVSAGFRYIVPDDILHQAKNACNVHPSLLPWGRGAHPNVWAIVEGEPAGVSIHEMTAELDKGPIFTQRAVDCRLDDHAGTLYERLENAAFGLFVETWPQLRDGVLRATPQPKGGSFHRVRDLQELSEIDFDSTVTWRRAIDILRGLTHPPHRNIVLHAEGRRYHVQIDVTEIPE